MSSTGSLDPWGITAYVSHLGSVVHLRWGPFIQYTCLWHISDSSSPVWDAKLFRCLAIKRQRSALSQTFQKVRFFIEHTPGAEASGSKSGRSAPR